MALTELAIRNAKPRDKAYKMSDAGGLFLSVTPAGGKLWRVKFRVGGKEKLLSLGGWPDASLAVARRSGIKRARHWQRAWTQLAKSRWAPPFTAGQT